MLMLTDTLAAILIAIAKAIPTPNSAGELGATQSPIAPLRHIVLTAVMIARLVKLAIRVCLGAILKTWQALPATTTITMQPRNHYPQEHRAAHPFATSTTSGI